MKGIKNLEIRDASILCGDIARLRTAIYTCQNEFTLEDVTTFIIAIAKLEDRALFYLASRTIRAELDDFITWLQSWYGHIDRLENWRAGYYKLGIIDYLASASTKNIEAGELSLSCWKNGTITIDFQVNNNLTKTWESPHKFKLDSPAHLHFLGIMVWISAEIIAGFEGVEIPFPRTYERDASSWDDKDINRDIQVFTIGDSGLDVLNNEKPFWKEIILKVREGKSDHKIAFELAKSREYIFKQLMEIRSKYPDLLPYHYLIGRSQNKTLEVGEKDEKAELKR